MINPEQDCVPELQKYINASSSTRMSCRVYCDFPFTGEGAVAFEPLRRRCEVKTTQEFRPSHEEVVEGVRGATVILCSGRSKIDEEIIDAAGRSLKAVCTRSAGYNHIDLDACKKRNIRVGYVGEVSAISGSMAEFTIGLMIATGRRFKEAMEELPKGGLENSAVSFLNGFQILNSTVGLVGLGKIGQEVARRLTALGVEKIFYCGSKKKPEGDALGVQYTTFEDLLQKSDYVVTTCALNDQTRGLFNQAAFNLMKPTSIFINVARGGIVDQEALYDALTTNKIFAAGLDVVTPEPIPADHPLIALKNCVILPHIGTDVLAVRIQMSEAIVANILAVIDGKPMPYELHF